MNKVRFSRNIPKEKVLFNQSALTGIEYTLNSLIRDTLFEESFTTRLGKGILSEQEINEMGKIFYRISHTNTDELYHSHINTLTIHPSQLVPVIMQFLKYLQGAGYAYRGHIEEQNKLANQVNLTLELIKGLDSSLRVYTFVLPLIRALEIYYLENYEIYEL